MNIKFLNTIISKHISFLARKDRSFLNISMAAMLVIGCYFMYQGPAKQTITPNILQQLNFTDYNNTGLQDFQLSLQKEEKQIWQDIENALGITKEQFLTMKKDTAWYASYIQSMQSIIEKRKIDRPISQTTKDLIQQMFDLCKIDSKNIQILSSHGFSPIVTTDTILFVNDEKFSTLSDSMKKFILIHEMSHIINQDNSKRCLLLDLQAEQPQNEALKQATNRLKYFSEKRADAFASLHGQEFAQGQIEFMEYLLKLYGDYPSSSHPSNSDRLAMGQTLLALMEQKNSSHA